MPCSCETPSINAEVYRDLCTFGDFPLSFEKKKKKGCLSLSLGFVFTWFGAFGHGAVVHLILELGPIVVHVDHIYVEVDGILHLVSVHVHGVSSQLWVQKTQGSQGSGLIFYMN